MIRRSVPETARPQTAVEKIIARHSGGGCVQPGDIRNVFVDARLARDFGGANVVRGMGENRLKVQDPSRTFLTFDCNPTGSDPKYAENQQFCRIFARREGIRIFDITEGIGTHIAVDEGLVRPGDVLVSTDSHANIVGAIGAFGQGMGDQDIAAVFAFGSVWFRVPLSMRTVLSGQPPKGVESKDIGLALLRTFGASGLLGYVLEIAGPASDLLTVSGRMTVSSLATEMGGIAAFFAPNQAVLRFLRKIGNRPIEPAFSDPKALFEKTVKIDLNRLEPLISRPGHPEDVVPVRDVEGRPVDSVFIGSCTNGRFEDMKTAARILKNTKVAPGVVLKIVPATRQIWTKCLKEGLIDLFMEAGALVGNPGCAGCAAGQIGQNGPEEVTVSTGNRNFVGKQGKGDVYLASPSTAAASALAGRITVPGRLSRKVSVAAAPVPRKAVDSPAGPSAEDRMEKPRQLEGRVWVIPKDNIDTDMIFHNRYLTMTDRAGMGKVAFDNLKGWEDFAAKSRPGDIIVTGSNFGAGSSRQQAVDCFLSLGIAAIIARSFGSIYERNAVNAGLPVLTADLVSSGIRDGEILRVDLDAGSVLRISTGEKVPVSPFSGIQMGIYQRGGLLHLPQKP
jgi:3-isopropylmalate/(R)-2-methylmalate dehydratase large subunit